jgi:signal transduction histidine kinase
VFWNLIKNAVKFTPHGGRIEVRTRNHTDHFIVIEVVDTGVGIDPALQPRIFDAFEQGGRSVTSKFGGLGLGLAIAKRAVELHKGRLWAVNASPGLIVKMEMPVTPEPVTSPELSRSLAG